MTGGDATCICGRCAPVAYRRVAKVTIPWRMIALNDYTDTQRKNRYSGAKEKKQMQYDVQMILRKDRVSKIKITKPVFIRFVWVEKGRTRDKDNVAFAKKIIFDALVSEGVIAGDGWRHVAGFSDRFALDKGNPRVIIEILEVENENADMANVQM